MDHTYGDDIQPIKKILLLLSLLLATNAWASIPDDVHEKCKDAKDYVGCMKFYSEDALIEKNNKKEIKDSEIPAQIDMARIRGSRSLVFDLYVDDRFIATLEKNSTISMKIDSGEHLVCLGRKDLGICKNEFTEISKDGLGFDGIHYRINFAGLMSFNSGERYCYRQCLGSAKPLSPFYSKRCMGQFFKRMSCGGWDKEFKDLKKVKEINY